MQFGDTPQTTNCLFLAATRSNEKGEADFSPLPLQVATWDGTRRQRPSCIGHRAASRHTPTCESRTRRLAAVSLSARGCRNQSKSAQAVARESKLCKRFSGVESYTGHEGISGNPSHAQRQKGARPDDASKEREERYHTVSDQWRARGTSGCV